MSYKLSWVSGVVWHTSGVGTIGANWSTGDWAGVMGWEAHWEVFDMRGADIS